jgi:hypothetical protein
VPYPLKILDEKASLQKTTITKFTGGLNSLDREDQLDPSEALRCENLVLKKGRLYQDTGYAAFADAVEGTPQVDYQFFKKDGTGQLMLVTTASVYRYASGVGQWQYVKGDGGSDLTSAAVATDTSLEVTSSADFSPTDPVGIELDDGTQHRTTVATVPDGTHITLDDAMPGAAGIGKVVVLAVQLSGDLDHAVIPDTVASHDWFVFTNGVDVVKRYDGIDCVDVPNLPSSGNTVCKALRVYNSALFLLNTTEGGTAYPQRVRRSDIGDPENWTTGTAGYDDLFDSSDYIITGEVLGPYLIVYRERSIDRGEFVGQGGINYNYEPMVQGEGCISSQGIVNMGDYHVMLGNANIYEYRAGFDLNPIGDKIYSLIFQSDADINREYRPRAFAFFVEEVNEIWFFLPSSSSETCDTLLRYNISEENFAYRKFADSFVGYGFYERQTSLDWSDLVGYWSAQTWQWGSAAVKTAAPTTHLCADSGGLVQEYQYTATDDDGDAIAFVFETKDFILDEALLRLDTVEGYLRGSGVLIEYSSDEGDTWNTIGTVTNAGNSHFLLGKQDIMQRIRFRFSGSDPQFMMTFFQFYWKLETPR